jgi:catechol 2,3-dioxygenase-like lactoylglutathione lyase family enzyme
MIVSALDHFVLTVRDVSATCDFYTTVLGMTQVTFDQGRSALKFGNQQINVHQAGREIAPHALVPTPGSADLCFLVDGSMSDVAQRLAACRVTVELGPVKRTGATGTVTSIYIRDPDGNLVELACAGGE